MIPKKIIAFAITFAMIGAGLSIVGLNTIAEDAARPFEDVTGAFPLGGQPKMAWHDSGDYALAVTGVNKDIWRYDRATGFWGGVAFMSGNADDVFNDVVYDGMTKFYFVGYTLPGPVPLAAEWTHGGPAVVGYTFAIVPELGAFEGVCLADEGGMTDYSIFAVGEDTGTGTALAYWYNWFQGQWEDADIPGAWDFIAGDIMHDAAFNSGSGQYYAVGEDGEGYGTMYTWPAVGAPDPDTWTLPMETGALKTIGFSSLGNYAIIGGAPHPHGNIFHYNGTAFYNLTYTDDTIEDFSFAPGFTWGVAVGWNLAMEGAYFYHYAPTKMIDMSFKLPSGTQQLYGVAAKGATSPMSALAAGSGSVLAGFPMASNSDTALKVNTDVPHGYTVDMWDMADWTGVPGASKLDQDVDILETYTFRGEFNYTVGGVNKFFDGTNNVRVNLTAWYDNGAQFSASTPVVGANEDDRTRQFSAVWEDGVAGDSAALTYAAGGPTNEFTLASSGYNVSGKLDDHYFIYFNITFEKQTWASTGAFSGDGGFDYYNPDIRLDDINSWDFRFEIYDAGFLTANNYTYGEFGVFTSSIVTVVGDPAANAPPGTFGAALFPYSNITYSCNRDYYVNVSIEDLADLTATNFITANWVDLQHVNINGQALAANTDILAVTPIVAAGTEVGIWGNWGATQMLPTPRNGTTANGPLGSDFWLPLNNQATQVRWWIDVPAGTAEGLYEGAITVTIGYYP